MISIERNNNDGPWSCDPNWLPAEYGLRIDDRTVIGLIEEVLKLHKGEERSESKRNAMQEAACSLVQPFWDDELWVVTYSVEQGYGGSEEGGWWYPTYSLERRHRVLHTDWAVGIPLAKKELETAQGWCKANESGQFGSYGGWQRYEVYLELVPQGWDNENGPGKKERISKPVYC